jgi:hypothetical protein
MQAIHPQLDLFDQVVRVIGWPTLIGILVWAIRTYDKGQQQFKDMDKNSVAALATGEQVKTMVSVMQTNHLAHLQTGIEAVAKSNDEAVAILREIKTGITVLSDRFPRT